jgi:hypothetical protein
MGEQAMATDMTEEELEREQVSAGNGSECGYRNPEVDDDYVDAEAFTSADGRRFRVIHMSGFSSNYGGVMNAGEWLDEGEDASDFGQS